MPGKRGAPTCCAECGQAVAARVALRRSSGRDRDSVCKEPAAEVSRADRKPLGDAAPAPRGPVTLPEAGFPSSRGHLAVASAGPCNTLPSVACGVGALAGDRGPKSPLNSGHPGDFAELAVDNSVAMRSKCLKWAA